jgi:hypothetical protein
MIAVASFAQAAPTARLWDRVALAAVLVAALVVAGVAYAQFLQAPEFLWDSCTHDRNSHYRLGQRLALSLRQGDLVAAFRQVHAARVWPPLHSILLGAVLTVGGIDYRLAVLPSLAAWVASCVLIFLTARRLVPRLGNLAGAAAALFFLASPAHRAFATDIMLESLGACLTLAGLYCYVLAIQEPSAGAGRGLGLALTGLFLTKYNYWTLLAAGLLLAALAAHRQPLRDTLVAAWGRLAPGRWLRDQLKHPLTYLLVPSALLTLAVLAAVLIAKQPIVLQFGGREIELRTTQNLAYVTYVLLVLRLLPWWRRVAHPWVLGLAAPARQVVLWHGYALALWFLWPQKLGYFLWYLTYGSHGRAADASPWAGNAAYYWACLVEDYHGSLAALLAALVLAGLAVLLWRRLRPGAAGVLLFLAVAALLTNYHSANRSRFLHPWLATTWVAAGAGLACVAGSASSRRARLALGAGGLASLAALLGPGLVEHGHAPEGGPCPERPTLLALADCYLPRVADARRPTLLSNGPLHAFFEWTFAERYGRRPADVNLGWTKDPADRAAFDAWLRETASDELVLVEVTDAEWFELSSEEPADWLRKRLEGQDVFVRTEQAALPLYRGITVSVWRRGEPVVSAP